eukprot:1462548-Pleurochrysis_carterae.AAC.2
MCPLCSRDTPAATSSIRDLHRITRIGRGDGPRARSTASTRLAWGSAATARCLQPRTASPRPLLTHQTPLTTPPPPMTQTATTTLTTATTTPPPPLRRAPRQLSARPRSGAAPAPTAAAATPSACAQAARSCRPHCRSMHDRL